MASPITRFLIYLYRIPFRLTRKAIEKHILRIEGGSAFSPSIRMIYSKYYGLHIGYGSYGGCFIHENFPGPCDIEFGRYCSIGSNLRVFRANHPADNFTLHPFLYNPCFGYVEKDILSRPPLKIGNDVWTGSNVIICPGVRIIGDGAIIGAGSVVTHDVAPYTIVAGNPARVIKSRFNERQIAYLQSSLWWELDFDTLKDRASSINTTLQSLKDDSDGCIKQ